MHAKPEKCSPSFLKPKTPKVHQHPTSNSPHFNVTPHSSSVLFLNLDNCLLVQGCTLHELLHWESVVSVLVWCLIGDQFDVTNISIDVGLGGSIFVMRIIQVSNCCRSFLIRVLALKWWGIVGREILTNGNPRTCRATSRFASMTLLCQLLETYCRPSSRSRAFQPVRTCLLPLCSDFNQFGVVPRTRTLSRTRGSDTDAVAWLDDDAWGWSDMMCFSWRVLMWKSECRWKVCRKDGRLEL